jgi:hypothetical protein
MVLGVDGLPAALGSAEPPCPEHDAVKMPAANAAAVSLFIKWGLLLPAYATGSESLFDIP